MYSTCLFCHGDLGKNAAIEHFPLGRRLAFDGERGRLWVVCRMCERWNLTPLEERWEAIEECEREFRASKLRVSTDHVGLARLKEGLELVRIGEPQRPEMAAWRYGDQFGRRRRRQIAIVGGVAAAAGSVLVVGPMIGIVGGTLTTQLLYNLILNAGKIYNARRLIHVPTSDGSRLRVRLSELPKTQLHASGDSVLLRIRGIHGDKIPSEWRIDSGRPETELAGDDAIRAATALLPSLNAFGGSRTNVSDAVSMLEESNDPKRLFRRAVGTIEKWESRNVIGRNHTLLKNLPAAGRLALEMATHEESERRALEGELHILEEAWREAEVIAGIADDMFLPPSVDEDLRRLKRNHNRT